MSTRKDVESKSSKFNSNSVLNGNTVGVVVLGLLLLNVLGPVTSGMGQLLAYRIFQACGLI